jgi:hypothetical protein
MNASQSQPSEGFWMWKLLEEAGTIEEKKFDPRANCNSHLFILWRKVL